MESKELKPGVVVTVTSPKGRKIRGSFTIADVDVEKNGITSVDVLPHGIRRGDVILYAETGVPFFQTNHEKIRNLGRH